MTVRERIQSAPPIQRSAPARYAPDADSRLAAGPVEVDVPQMRHESERLQAPDPLPERRAAASDRRNEPLAAIAAYQIAVRGRRIAMVGDFCQSSPEARRHPRDAARAVTGVVRILRDPRREMVPPGAARRCRRCRGLAFQFSTLRAWWCLSPKVGRRRCRASEWKEPPPHGGERSRQSTHPDRRAPACRRPPGGDRDATSKAGRAERARRPEQQQPAPRE